jgi:predicted DNA-binding transcriptional regulator YafY
MKNIINQEIVRQIEFAAMVLEKPRYYTELDISEYFKVSQQTIRRDAEKLREMGVDIHSNKKTYEIFKCDLKTLNDLICSYLALNKFDTIKNLSLIRKKYGAKTLMLFVKMLNAISKRHVIEIIYNKNPREKNVRINISPISLMRAGRNIYLIAYEDDSIDKPRNFLLEKINDINFTSTKSKIQNVNSMPEFFKTSWGVFTGGEIYDVKLKFSKEMGEDIKDRFYMETQQMFDEDDCFIISFKVNLSYEFISWVMGWGNLVEVLEPPLLKDIILEKSHEIIEKYKS